MPSGGSGAAHVPSLVPSLSLPKGGGAIRGLGEKFSANPVKGTGQMTVPIATSPGRAGFGPQLSLSYDSGSGNGPFGFGWSLLIPAITRKTEKGLPRYDDAGESDVYVLSGAEDLVPVYRQDHDGSWVAAHPGHRRDEDGFWVRDQAGRLVVHEDDFDGHRVRRYRPRIEGLFALIERWTDLSTGEIHWRSVTRENVTTLYGRDNNSRVFDPADPRPEHPTRIFGWLICTTYDDKGNAMVYEYAAEDDAGVDRAQANERNRTRSANRYVKRIKYGNRASRLVQPDLTQATWLFEAVFDYDEGHYYDELPPTPGQPQGEQRRLVRASPSASGQWAVRPDSFSSHRAGFEVRTHRRCRRVLMFHRFEELNEGRIDELGDEPYLVSATELDYADLDYSRGVSVEDELSHQGSSRFASFLRAITQSGFIRDDSQAVVERSGVRHVAYIKRSLPPLELEYSKAKIHDEIRYPDAHTLENLPGGVDGTTYQWVDLDGEGLSGILTEQAGAWSYKPSLGDGRFGALQVLRTKPSTFPMASGATQLLDLSGDGRLDVVSFVEPTPGFYERTQQGDWEAFRAFRSLPNLRWGDPNQHFVDLDGDGLADLLITEDDVFTWYPSLAEDGFGPARRVRAPEDEERGPRLVSADHKQAIYFADLCGDGLPDLVRIRNGEVCYWPNIGYGRFGAKVTMDNAPCFDDPDRFDQRRIRLADIDGSGTTDIIYFGRGGARLYFNQSGNRWTDARPVQSFPMVDNLSTVAVADLQGNGTACLVWSSPSPADRRHPLRYIDLMGGRKPHLLVKAANNLGGETTIEYAPSTKFYLADKAAGTPWVTKVPFPVYVVERIEVRDRVSRNRFVTRYKYHHGYFDGHEREFRGFGMVEHWDAEAFEDYVVGVQRIDGHQELAPELNQPSVTSRTWYHTGAFSDEMRVARQYLREHYRQQRHVPEPILPAGADAVELHECARALSGLMLRKEVYSFDGSPDEQHPYVVVENAFEVRRLQPRGAQRHGVYAPVGRESISLSYERNPSDPRVAHDFRLELDEHGNVQKSCSVVYGRKVRDPLLPPEVTRAQQQLYITYGEADYTPDIKHGQPAAAYRLRVPCESRSYEITGVSPDADRFELEEIRAKIAGAASIDYETVANGAAPQRRLLAREITVFLDNGLSPMPLGQWDDLGLIHRSYRLAFTRGVIQAHYAGKVSDAELAAAGYVHFNGDADWWIPSDTAIYPSDAPERFYNSIGATDPLGLETIATWDRYDLLREKVEVRQAAWNVVAVVNDYRVLGPVLLTDLNKNRTGVEYDELGMVVKTAVMGKEGSLEGDTLADPTTRMEYELFHWMNDGKPNCVHTFARERHGAANTRWQESYTYLNGGGGVAMVKTQAHPGKAFKVNPDGTKVEVDADPRWVGNGRTILNNKGNPVKKYEPYFSVTHEYEDEKVVREIGVTSVAYYDPVGRVVRTLFPNGTFMRVEINAWAQRTFDANDTVKESRWYIDRGSPDPTSHAEPLNDAERRAAWLAAKHADTPDVIHLDSLGRQIYAVSDYGAGKTAALRSESDLTGRFTRMFDQRGREVASGFVAMHGAPVMGESAEKGRRFSLRDARGAMIKTWDEHGRQFRTEYDALRRPVSTFVTEPGQPEILFQYIVYGDRLANAAQLNLLGATHQIFDQAGMMRVPELDFKGNPRRVERVLAKDYTSNLDWSALPAQPDYAAVQAAANVALNIDEVFAVSSQHDALNRPTQVTLPDGTVIVPSYNEANLLAALRAQVRGQGPFIDFLKDQDYNARGQRQLAHHGNEVITRYFYDPTTFRLTNLLTHKSSAAPHTQSLQDIFYSYDPIGNVTQIRDDAQQTNFFAGAVVKPESMYEYDALYQLVRATGREHAALGNDATSTHADLDHVRQLPHINDLNAVRRFTEEYEYDLLGNITAVKHRFQAQPGAGSGWTRRYRYAYEHNPSDRTNRLMSTSMPGDPDVGPYGATYEHDVYGNMTRMPHLASMGWNFMDQLRRADLGGGGTAHYVYGMGGNRLRKVVERPGDLTLEWIYLGSVVIFRRRRRSSRQILLERWTVHISDDTGRIAQVDTKTRDEGNQDPANPLNAPLIRYQYANRVGSATLETDESGNPISYEEYHPFGTTAYRASKPGFDLSLKRYRFSGKERDEETGLYYFGARYYAAWLGRWTSSDPAGFIDGLQLYRYCGNNPINLVDPYGLQGSGIALGGKPEAIRRAQRTHTEAAGRRYEAWVRGQVVEIDGQGYTISGGTRAWTDEGGGHWWIPDAQLVPVGGSASGEGGGEEEPIEITVTAPPRQERQDSSTPPGSGEASASASTEPPAEPASSAGGAAEPAAPPGGSSEPPRESSALDGVPQPNAGAAAVTTWDSVQRGRYTAGNVARSAEAVRRVQAATRAGDAVRAWEAAREASDARNAARLATQGRLSPGGRALSQAIDAGRSFESSVAEYSARAPGARTPSPTRDAFTIAERVAEGSGRSNPWMSRLARGGRVLGPVGIAVGLGFAARNISNASPEDRGRVAAGEAGNFAGGMAGVSLGMSAGVALAGGVSAFLIGLGVAAGPIGWLAIGLGILGGLAGAWAFGKLGRGIGEGLYDIF